MHMFACVFLQKCKCLRFAFAFVAIAVIIPIILGELNSELPFCKTKFLGFSKTWNLVLRRSRLVLQAGSRWKLLLQIRRLVLQMFISLALTLANLLKPGIAAC